MYNNLILKSQNKINQYDYLSMCLQMEDYHMPEGQYYPLKTKQREGKCEVSFFEYIIRDQVLLCESTRHLVSSFFTELCRLVWSTAIAKTATLLAGLLTAPPPQSPLLPHKKNKKQQRKE